MSKRGRRRRSRRKGNRTRERASAPAEREYVDPRGIFTTVTAIDGKPADKETVISAIQVVRLPTGQELWFQTPLVPAFYLHSSKAFRDRAEPLRVAATSELTETPDGTFRPTDPPSGFDCLEGLSAAVVLASAAIEAYANDTIDRLPENAEVKVKRRHVPVILKRESMVRQLSIGEKLDLAVPQVTGRSSIKGSAAWETFRGLQSLRDELVHVKDRGYSTDPASPSVFGRIMLGEASRAPEDAASVIDACEPDWLRAELGLANAEGLR